VDGKLVRLASSIWERMNERKKRGKTLVVKLGPLIGVALFVVSTFFFSGGLAACCQVLILAVLVLNLIHG
jgi:VIT1/CCC1 family predicted Fe2+/Mn2+ transporter